MQSPLSFRENSKRYNNQLLPLKSLDFSESSRKWTATLLEEAIMVWVRQEGFTEEMIFGLEPNRGVFSDNKGRAFQ